MSVPAPILNDPVRRPVNVRSVFLGLVGAVGISALTYYNDYALGNTFLIGSFLPVGLLLYFLLVILLVNAPLLKFAPRFALSPGELAVALGMVLVACAVPSAGLMRYLPSSMVSMHYYAGGNRQYQDMLTGLQVPDWVFPTFSSSDPASHGNDPVITQFWNRAPTEVDSFSAHWRAVPWRAWMRPIAAWGVLMAAIWGAVLCLGVIVRRQWFENERLSFPLASVYLSLIEAPPKGKAINALFSARPFWVAFVLVFAVRGINALAIYHPAYLPIIPLRYDLGDILRDAPWAYAGETFKAATLYFAVVGLTFLLQTRVSLSLWLCFVLVQGVHMWCGMTQTDFTAGEQTDQTFGSLLAFALMIVWIGRQHWLLVIKQMFRGRREGEPQGRYLPYPLAGWGLVVCLIVAAAWLRAAGTTLGGAVLLVTIVMTLFVVVAKVVAETGLFFVGISAPPQRPWIYALNALAHPIRTTPRTFFFSAWFHNLFTHDQRESLSAFSTHALRVADEAAFSGKRTWRGTASFIVSLGLALGVAYVVAWGATLYVEYTHASTLAARPSSPINKWGVVGAPDMLILQPTIGYLPPRMGPSESHSRLGHCAAGAAITLALSLLRLRFDAWPVHPVGYLLAYSYPISIMWFSIFVGWLAKVLVLRFGGARFFRDARPFFLGLILGDVGAAGFWLIVAVARSSQDAVYYRMIFLPT